MGFFKGLATLNRQGNEIRRNTDVGAQTANGLATLRATNAMTEQQVANSDLAVSGVEAVATVASVRPTGAFVDLAPVLQLDLLVMHIAPVPVTHHEAVLQVNLPLVQPGASIAVKVDPTDHRRIWIDWTRTG